MPKIILILIFSVSACATENETKFDQFVDQKKEEMLSEKTRKQIEPSKDSYKPKDGETKFDRLIDKAKKKYIHKDLKPTPQKGLVDPAG